LPPRIAQLMLDSAERLRERGARVVSVSLPSLPLALPCYYILASGECMSNLSRFDGARFGSSLYHTDAVDRHEIDKAMRAKRADGSLATGDADAAASASLVSDALSYHSLYSLNRALGFSREVQRRILAGSFVLSSEAYAAFFLKAQKVRRKLADELKQLFEGQAASAAAGADASGVHLLMTPTAVSGALPFAAIEKERRSDSTAPFLNDVFTIPASLAGVPAVSVCGGVDESGLPLGVQLVAPWLQEARLLTAAHTLHQNVLPTLEEAMQLLY
jgi:aspartyl-tRNA(Asn)/glutamyl-tRNA(Gln) amidotransferase subunit A